MYWPSSHSVHIVPPVSVLKVPAAQKAHALSPLTAVYKPTSHATQLDQPAAPLNVPLTHCAQALKPLSVTKVPAAQRVHTVAAPYVENDPAAHRPHADAPSPVLTLPIRPQSTQPPWVLATSVRYCPPPQRVQPMVPVPVAYEPAEQLSHCM